MVTKIERSALWLAALRGHVSVCQVLLDAGADIELSEECGFTPLLVAAAQGHTETVAALHARGARVCVGGGDVGGGVHVMFVIIVIFVYSVALRAHKNHCCCSCMHTTTRFPCTHTPTPSPHSF